MTKPSEAMLPRYKRVIVKLTWKQTISIWWSGLWSGHWTWIRDEITLKAVYFGESGYFNAEYGITWITNPKAMLVKTPKP